MRDFLIKLNVFFLAVFGFTQSTFALPGNDSLYVIHFVHVLDHDSPKGRAANLFAYLVNREFKDILKVKVYPNTRLYNDQESIEEIQLSKSRREGIMAAPAIGKLTHLCSNLSVFDMPFVFKDITKAHRFMDSETGGRLLKNCFDKTNNIKALDFLDSGMRVVSMQSKMPPLSLSVFKGKRFRIQQNARVQEQHFGRLGFKPKALAWADVLGELGDKSIDAQASTFSNIYKEGFHAHQNYIINSNHSYLGYVWIVNHSFWFALPKGVRKKLEEIIKLVRIQAREFASESEMIAKQKLERHSVKIINLPSVEKRKWHHIASELNESIELIIDKDVINAVRQ